MVRPANSDQSLYFDYPQFDFQRPAEMDGDAATHPVIIVGGGPVGVTAALELARHGIASVVLDDKNTVNDGSRAICIARHSMECLQQLGLADRFLEKALPWTHGTSYYRDREVYRLEMPHSQEERFYPMYNLQQQYIELFLVEQAMQEDLVDIRWCSRVDGLRQDENGVSVNVVTPEGDYELNGSYLLAADGARSIARKSLGLKLNGDAYEGRYVIVDIQMALDYPTERRAFFDPVSNPGLTILVHKQPDNIWRIDYQVDDEVDEVEELREETIRARVAPIVKMIGGPDDWKLEWWSIYKAYTLALDDYRCGRTFFAGDAAHLVPIFGVRGLNSGLADAMNIAWKLAYVIHGWAEDSLLDSYSPERRGATLEVFENASKSTKFMTPPSRGHELMRTAALSLATGFEFTRSLVNPRQSQPYTYINSSPAAYRDLDAEFDGGPGTGAPIFNCLLDDNTYLLDYIDESFSGIYFSNSGIIDAGLKESLAHLDVGEEKFRLLIVSSIEMRTDAGVVLPDRDGSIFSSYGAIHDSFYLVRPDRHVLARWKVIDIEEVLQAMQACLKGEPNE